MQSKCSQNVIKMQSKCSQNSSNSWSAYRLKSFQSCSNLKRIDTLLRPLFDIWKMNPSICLLIDSNAITENNHNKRWENSKSGLSVSLKKTLLWKDAKKDHPNRSIQTNFGTFTFFWLINLKKRWKMGTFWTFFGQFS